MNTLASLLQSSGAVPEHLLIAARERQARYSGSIGTNLLELNGVHARSLDELLATHTGLPSVSLVGLMAQSRPSSAMPPQLREDPMFAPLAMAKDKLWLVIHPDTPRELLEQVAQKNPELHFAVTAECCFFQIWAQAYGTSPSARFAKLTADYIDQLQASPPGELLPAPVVRELIIPHRLTGRPGERAKVPAAEPSDPPDNWNSIESAVKEAKDRDTLTHLLQRAAGLLSERVALFRIRDKELIGMPGPSPALDVQGQVLPLSSSLSHALVHPRSIRRCLDLDLRLAVGLEEAVPCICAPVGLRGRPVLLLYLDRAGETFRPDEVDAVHRLCGITAGQLLAHLRRANRDSGEPPTPRPALHSAGMLRYLERGDTKPEMPVLSAAECNPEFWTPHSAQDFESWSELDRQAFESALHSENLEYFEQAPRAAIEELAQRLPGPRDEGVEVDADKIHMASRWGPIPRLLVGLQANAVEPVLRGLHSQEAITRFVAGLIFQELRDDRALDALAALCFDPDPQVRRISARVLETYRESPAFAPACAQVRDCLDHPDLDRQAQAAAALGILRDVSSIGALIERLDDETPALRRGALESLCSISGQQFGKEKQAWHRWYQKHQEEHRYEWLASSLAHGDSRVRVWANDELLRLTGFEMGFDPHGPRSQRNAAIARWHRWWSNQRSPAPDEQAQER